MKHEWHPEDGCGAALFGLLLAPKAYAFFGTGPMVDSSVLLTAPLLLALVGVVVADGIADGEGVVAGVRTIRLGSPRTGEGSRSIASREPYWRQRRPGRAELATPPPRGGAGDFPGGRQQSGGDRHLDPLAGEERRHPFGERLSDGEMERDGEPWDADQENDRVT